jgi:hypothetical protein
MECRIEKCKCSHAFQDEAYGVGKRVLNPCAKEGYYRCSICVNTQFLDKFKAAEKPVKAKGKSK